MNKKIPVYGDGFNIREWIHVEDHVRAIIKILKKGKIGNTYNIGSGYVSGEIVTITAGSGTGKSQICREISYDLISKGNTIGYVALEESISRSVRGLVSIPLILVYLTGRVGLVLYWLIRVFYAKKLAFHD